jgi:dolichol-phosphate mannosyltransferase
VRHNLGSPALVIVPTYNEKDSLSRLIPRLFSSAGPGIELLVVDDASPDGTAAAVRELQERYGGVHLMERPAKQGLGTAYLAGFRWALARGYSAVVEMDADLSHDPADVTRLLEGLKQADLVVGSRYVPGGGIEDWGALRRLLSRAGNLYARKLLGFDVLDSTSGFRAYRASTLSSLLDDEINSEGYSFQIELTWRVHLGGGSIAEVPIIFVERSQGTSKLSRAIVLEALVRVTWWGLGRALGRTPRSKMRV